MADVEGMRRAEERMPRVRLECQAGCGRRGRVEWEKESEGMRRQRDGEYEGGVL